MPDFERQLDEAVRAEADRQQRIEQIGVNPYRYLDALGVAKYKWPERLEFVEALPQTNVGKIDKKRLRADVVAKLVATP